jgi:hypothetical protein
MEVGMSFEHMNGAVDAICNSLMNEPHKWVFETYTFYNKGYKNTEYWSGYGHNDPITTIWVGTCEDIFSESQGKRIREAYKVARAKQASESQKKVIESMLPKPINVTANKKRWWSFLFN